jgi:hypothetical protein
MDPRILRSLERRARVACLLAGPPRGGPAPGLGEGCRTRVARGSWANDLRYPAPSTEFSAALVPPPAAPRRKHPILGAYSATNPGRYGRSPGPRPNDLRNARRWRRARRPEKAKGVGSPEDHINPLVPLAHAVRDAEFPTT